MTNIKIGIADDHIIVRNSLVDQIKQSLNCTFIAESSNGKDFLDHIKKSNLIPDIVCIDLSMPIMNGYETTQHIRTLYPSTKILILSFVAEANAIIHLFNLGINGFASKTDAKFNFASALQEILDTGFLKNQHFHKIATEPINWKKFAFSGNIELTHKEMAFIQGSLKHASLADIGKELHCSIKTVENYRDSVYTKLGIKTKTDLTEFANKIGL